MNKSMLEKYGYRVTAMSSSMDAFQAFQNDPEKFDIIITDMTMPQITGAELARRILAIRNNIPIILCTGYSDLINEQKAKDIGICEYILKPIRTKDLATKVHKALDDSNPSACENS